MPDQNRYPYSTGAPLYEAAGWTRFVPLSRGKGVVPTGVSGNHGADPTPEQRALWMRTRGRSNGCIILPEGTIGFDVDHYGTKRGGDTLAHGDKLWGSRPPTVRSTSRSDGISGIRLYRVPVGTPKFPGQIQFHLADGSVLSDIELVQHHHRNVNAWPSIHWTGRQYQWLDEAGNVVGIPTPGSLPMLSQRWIDGLLGGSARTSTRSPRTPKVQTSAYSVDEAAVVAKAMTLGGMSWTVTVRLGRALADLSGQGSRYDSMVRHTLALLRYGQGGHPGVEHALDIYRDAYRRAVGADRDGGELAADSEFDRAVSGCGALLLLDADPVFDPMWTAFPLDPEIAARFEGAAIPYCCKEFDDFDESVGAFDNVQGTKPIEVVDNIHDFDEMAAITNCCTGFDDFNEESTV